MAESAAEQSEQEQKEIGREEFASASEVMQLFVKTSKAFRMYLPNNPLLVKFLEDLKGSMVRHLDSYGELKLDIDQFSLRYRGKTVYESRDPKDSLAFKMYSDGIRSLILSEGMDDREIFELLEIVGKDRPSDMDDDIVTLLWMRELPHVTYILAEDYLEFDSGGALAAPASQQEGIKGVYRQVVPSAPATPVPLMVSQNILTLSENEIEWLKRARDIDEKRDPFDEVVNVLSAILVAESDPSVFGEFVDIMTNLIGNLVYSGEFRHSVRLTRFFADLLKHGNLPQSHLERVKKAMDGPIAASMIKGLEVVIDAENGLTPEELKELIFLFGVRTIPPMCELLARVQKMDMRKAMVDALAEIGKGAPDAFYQFLTDQRWYLVRNAVLILRRIADPSSLEPVGRLMQHKEPRIRKEVLIYLQSSSDPRAKGYILRFLQDDVPSLRLNALNYLSSSRYMEALKPILGMTTSKGFESKDISEKKAIFEAIGELGSDGILPMLRDMILKRYWFNRSREKEAVMLAVAALRRIKSDAAVRLLEEAASAKKDDVRAFISQAIRSMAADRGKVRIDEP